MFPRCFIDALAVVVLVLTTATVAALVEMAVVTGVVTIATGVVTIAAGVEIVEARVEIILLVSVVSAVTIATLTKFNFSACSLFGAFALPWNVHLATVC